MVENDRRAPNYSANESFNRRLSNRESQSFRTGSPEMSFNNIGSPNNYSKRMNDESLNAMATGENDEDAGLKAIPFKIVMLGDVSVGKTCLV